MDRANGEDINTQKEIFEREQKLLREKISILELQGEQKVEEIQQLKNALDIVNTAIEDLGDKRLVVIYIGSSSTDGHSALRAGSGNVRVVLRDQLVARLRRRYRV
jgi:enolase